MRLSTKSALAIALGLAIAAPASVANMVVYPMTTKIGNEQDGVTQIQIFSKTDKVQYVKTRVAKVVNPAMQDEHEVDVSADAGLVVSPQRLVLTPGSNRTVRIISDSVPTEEIVYRVYFEPVNAPADAIEVESADGPAVKSQIGVSLIWGALVRVLPDNRNLQATLSADGSKLHNGGNVRIGVLEVGHCTSGSESDCKWTDVQKSVYPGQSLSIDSANRTGSVVIRYQTTADPAPKSMKLAR